MNSGFRNLLGGRDTSRFQAYLIAVALQMIVLVPLITLGFLKVQAPAFHPWGAALGGILFGLAMNWGGGCAGGLLYKIGSGTIGAIVAFVFLVGGYVTTETGLLKPFRELIQSAGGDVAAPPPWARWAAILIATGILVVFVRRPSQESGPRWNSRRTGLVVGAIGILAWIASTLTGRFFGMAIVPGGEQAFTLLTTSSHPGWDLFFVSGIPIGAYFSARRKNEFRWSTISGAHIWKLAGAGFVLGMAASLAGGCTVGHSLTGVGVLSLQSLLFTASAIGGAILGKAAELIPAQKSS